MRLCNKKNVIMKKYNQYIIIIVNTIKENIIVENVMDHLFVFIIYLNQPVKIVMVQEFVNIINKNLHVEIVMDQLFVNMININNFVVNAVVQLYVKLNYAKQEEIQNMKIIVYIVI